MNEKVLIVDDEQPMLDACRRALRNKYDIETALSGAQGLEKLAAQGPFAVVVSDMQMPHMNGAEFLSETKRQYPDSVRIMLTGNSDQGTAVSAINHGDVFRFLNKPCSNDELSSAISEGIERFHCESIERSLVADCLKKIDYVGEDHSENFDIQRLNARAGHMSNLSVAIARSVKLDQAQTNQCQIAGMMSCMGDLIQITRILPGALQSGSLKQDSRLNLATPCHDPYKPDPCQLSAYLLSAWGLPSEVVGAVKAHRTPRKEPHRIDDSVKKLSIDIADVLHASWLLLAEPDELPEELAYLEKSTYLANLSNNEMAKEWISVYESFSASH